MNQFCKVFTVTEGEDPTQVLFILSYIDESDTFSIQQITEIDGARLTLTVEFSSYEAAEEAFKEKVSQEWADKLYNEHKHLFE